MKLTELLYPFAFLPVCLLLYYVLPKRCRNAALLAASLLFFAWGTPEYLVLLVLAILLNYFAGLELESLLEDGKTGHARLVLVLTILADLLPLLFFKYYGEAAAALNRVFVLYEPAVSREKLWLQIPDYTAAVQAMCEENGVLFADNTQLSEDYADLWQPDGIHLLPEFYPHWAANLIFASWGEIADA